MKSFTFVALLTTAFASESLGGHLSHLFLNLKDTKEEGVAKNVLPNGDSVVSFNPNKHDDVAQLDKYISKLTVADLNVKEPRMVVNKPAKKHQATAALESSAAVELKARGARSDIPSARSDIPTAEESPRFIPAAPAHDVVVSSNSKSSGRMSAEMDNVNLVLSAFQKMPEVLAPVLHKDESNNSRGLPVESRGLPVESRGVSVESQGVSVDLPEESANVKKFSNGDSVVSSKSKALRGSSVEDKMVEALEKYVSSHANQKASDSPVMIVNVD